MKNKIGLVIGRFQPFHLGHLYLIQKALENAEKIIIAVGSSNVHDSDNPLSYEARVEIIEKVIEEEKLSNKVLKIVPSPDDPSDNEWLKKLVEQTGRFDIEIGNNDWTNNILEQAGYKVLRIPYFERDIHQGVLIRQIIEQDGLWQERVPKYLVPQIKKAFESAQ